MNLGPRRFAALASRLATVILTVGTSAWSFEGGSNPPAQLTLADLAAYRAALSGKATVDLAGTSGPPARVTFKDLWNRPEGYRGRRVTIEGRVERTFRQGAVGSFPALAEVWIASPAGDPFCVVVPQEDGTGSLVDDAQRSDRQATPKRNTELGQTVRFTGTFLKMVRYAAGDGARLAPLIVGDQPPVPTRQAATPERASSRSPGNVGGFQAGSPASWLFCAILALLAAGMFARRHLHLPSRRRSFRDQRRRMNGPLATDPPLEFIEPRAEA